MNYGSPEPTSSSRRRNGGSSRFVPSALKGVVPSSSTPSPSHVRQRNLLKSKSKPWQVDRDSWKEQLKIRKTVFDNFALEEDDNDTANDGGSVSEEEKKSTDTGNDRRERLGYMNSIVTSPSYDDEEVSIGLMQMSTSTSGEDSLTGTTATTTAKRSISFEGYGNQSSPIDLSSSNSDEFLHDHYTDEIGGNTIRYYGGGSTPTTPTSASELARNASQLAWSAAESSLEANGLLQRARTTLYEQQNQQQQQLKSYSYDSNLDKDKSQSWGEENSDNGEKSLSFHEEEHDEEEPPSLQKPEQRRSSLIIRQTVGGKLETYKVRSCKSLLMEPESPSSSDPLQRARMSLVLSHIAGRVEEVYTRHHHTVEGIGTGEARNPNKKKGGVDTEMEIFQQVRNNVIDELSVELSTMNTERFHVVLSSSLSSSPSSGDNKEENEMKTDDERKTVESDSPPSGEPTPMSFSSTEENDAIVDQEEPKVTEEAQIAPDNTNEDDKSLDSYGYSPDDLVEEKEISTCALVSDDTDVDQSLSFVEEQVVDDMASDCNKIDDQKHQPETEEDQSMTELTHRAGSSDSEISVVETKNSSEQSVASKEEDKINAEEKVQSFPSTDHPSLMGESRDQMLVKIKPDDGHSFHESCNDDGAVSYGGTVQEVPLELTNDQHVNIDSSLPKDVDLEGTTGTEISESIDSSAPIMASKVDAKKTDPMDSGEQRIAAAEGGESGEVVKDEPLDSQGEAEKVMGEKTTCEEVSEETELIAANEEVAIEEAEIENKGEEVGTPAEKPKKGKRQSMKGKKWKERLQAKKEQKQQNNGVSAISESSLEVQTAVVTPGSQSLSKPSANMESGDQQRPNSEAIPEVTSGSPSSQESSKSKKWKDRLAKKRNSKEDDKIAKLKSTEAEKPAKLENEESPCMEKEEKVIPEQVTCQDEEEHVDTTVPFPVIEICQETSIEKQTGEDEGIAAGAVSAASANKNSSNNDTVTKADTWRNQLKNSFMAFDAFLDPAKAPTTPQDDATQYTEVTIETGLPSQDMDQLKAPVAADSFDSSEYMEISVAETVEAKPREEPKKIKEASKGDDAINKLESSVHMQNLLSSRMFADDFNTNSMFQDEYDGKHATVTVRADFDDDDMTQLTFDQSFYGQGFEANVGDRLHHDEEDTYGFHDLVEDRKESTQLPTSSTHSPSSEDRSVGKQTFRGSLSSAVSEKSKQRIAELLRKDIWSRDRNVVESALHELGEEAGAGPAHRANIVRFGGVMAIIRAMDMNPCIEEIHIAACETLTKLALDADTQVAIGEVGGVSAIVGAMNEHVGHVKLESAACAALASITRPRHSQESSHDSRVVEVDDAVQALLMALKGHPCHPEIQANAFGALANLCMQNQDRLIEFSKAGGINAMTRALQQPWENEQEQHEAISSLSMLLRSLVDQQRSAKEEETSSSMNAGMPKDISEGSAGEGVLSAEATDTGKSKEESEGLEKAKLEGPEPEAPEAQGDEEAGKNKQGAAKDGEDSLPEDDACVIQ